MTSSVGRKWRYIKDRCVNAWWMIRRGNFKLVLESASVELNLRATQVKNATHQLRHTFHQVRHRYYQRRQRHHQLRSSYHQQRIDYHQQRLQHIQQLEHALYPALDGVPAGEQVADSEFGNLRKVVPSSYRPTVSTPYVSLQLKADPAAVELEIRQILSTFTFQDSDAS